MTRYATAFRALGCQINIWLDTPKDGQAILSPIAGQVEAYEQILSRFRGDSELSQLNQISGQWVQVSQVLFRNLVAARRAAELTNGLYNPLVLPALQAAGYDRSFEMLAAQTSPTPAPLIPTWKGLELDFELQAVYLPASAQADLGGIAKGWIAQTLARQLQPYGACLVDIGGDMVTIGQPDYELTWTIELAAPGSGENSPLLEINLLDGAVVTSGIDFRRWGQGQHHIIDPRTGQPAQTDVMSVTVIHSQALEAEAYAKAILILGAQAGLEWFLKQEKWNAAAFVVDQANQQLMTLPFERYIRR